MATAEVRRIITEQDRDAARRLKQIFERKKYTEGLTQSDLADMTGIPQPNLSQYMNGVIALRNGETITNLANALGVDPAEIDSRFEARYHRVPVRESSDLPLYMLGTGAVSEVRKRTRISTDALPKAYGIVIDTNMYSPVYQKGDILVVDPASMLRQHRTVAVQYAGRDKRYHLYTLLDVTNRSIKVVGIQGSAEIMEAANYPRRKALAEFMPTEPLTIPLRDLEHCHRVRVVDQKN